MTKSEGTYLSADGKTQVAYSVWTPEGQPKAVIQLIHGMCEYADRYADLARYLTDNGVVFCGNDHLGHGRTAAGKEELGWFGESGGSGYLIEDVRSLYLLMRKKYRRLPYIMLGHSMGSFILRAYMTRYGAAEDMLGTRLDGAILCGTSGGESVRLGLNMAKIIARLRGGRYRSKKLRSLVSRNYNRHCPEKGEADAWLSRDGEQRRACAEDPYCNFLFTADGYRDMLTLLSEVSAEDWAQQVPKSLPVLLISGTMDPVGNYGDGVQSVYAALEDAEVNDVDMKLYEGYRHELFFEKDRETVYADVLAFADHVAEGIHEARLSAAVSGYMPPLRTMGDYGEAPEDGKDK